MGFARIVALVLLLPGAITAQDAEDTARTGRRALAANEYTTAVYFLKQAVTLDPKHPSSWKDLCRAYLALGQVDNAVDACHRQVDVNPQSSGVYGILGDALWRKGRRDEAVSAFERDLAADPTLSGPHGSLSHYYCELGKYAEAVPELEKAISQAPNITTFQEDLGGAYLALGQADKGLAILNQLAQNHSTAAALNEVAYRLALHRVRLDLAQHYAEMSVTGATARLPMDGSEPITVAILRREVLLADCWDRAHYRKLAGGSGRSCPAARPRRRSIHAGEPFPPAS
jgi:tetratricopeptide (TPR) repeat protein